MKRYIQRDMPYFVRKGVEQYKANEALLKKIANRHEVDLHYLLAIWGIETAYGASAGNFGVIRSLATLGHGHRLDRIRLYFTKELVAALILVDKEIVPKDWKGSYAGASGSPQFMPSDVIRFSASFDGKVHADIWTADKPADALVSIAWFLRQKAKWNPSHDRTMIEVVLPTGFDFDTANQFKDLRPALDYARKGLKDAERKAVIHRWLEATVYLPAGCRGPAFLVNKNGFAAGRGLARRNRRQAVQTCRFMARPGHHPVTRPGRPTAEAAEQTGVSRPRRVVTDVRRVYGLEYPIRLATVPETGARLP
jgi:membrane-bound lytic murein transglycosylase B